MPYLASFSSDIRQLLEFTSVNEVNGPYVDVKYSESDSR